MFLFFKALEKKLCIFMLSTIVPNDSEMLTGNMPIKC